MDKGYSYGVFATTPASLLGSPGPPFAPLRLGARTHLPTWRRRNGASNGFVEASLENRFARAARAAVCCCVCVLYYYYYGYCYNYY